jgi:hypothetical protein
MTMPFRALLRRGEGAKGLDRAEWEWADMTTPCPCCRGARPAPGGHRSGQTPTAVCDLEAFLGPDQMRFLWRQHAPCITVTPYCREVFR